MKVLLPGWKLVRLADVADTSLGKMLDRGKPNGLPQVPYLRNLNVQWGRIDISDVHTMELADSERERFAVRSGDLLACEGGEIGRAAIWRGGDEYLAYQKAVHRVRSKGDLELPYLRYLLELYSANGTLSQFSTGSTIAHLPQQNFRELPVPLPPVGEQRRIIDVLEDHISRLDAAGSYLRSVRLRMGRLDAAQLQRLWDEAASSSPPTPVASIGQITTGSTPSTRQADVFGGTMPFLTPSDIGHGGQIGSWSRTLSDNGAAQVRIVGPNAVLAVCIGATLGKIGWVDRPVSSNQQVNCISLDSAVAIAPFVAAAMASPPFQRQMLREASSTTMPILNKSRFSRLALPLPDVATQECLLSQIEEMAIARERSIESLLELQRRSAALRRSLLAAAFAGQLTGRASDLEVVEEMPGA